MKRTKILNKALIFAHIIGLVFCNSYYTVIAPGTIKSNRKYPVAVTLHDAKEDCTMRVTIKGPLFNVSKDVYLRPFESKVLEFLPHKLTSGEYKLLVEGISGLNFKNETALSQEENYGANIFIQTDKVIYKANDLVQFRVLILDEHTRPLKVKEPIRIEILDTLGNRVKQFKDIGLTKSVYTGQFLLSEYPVKGIWTIKVTISGKYGYTKHKNIRVEKYVLPKFSVELRLPKYVLLQDGSLKVGIFGKYTYNKYVAGLAVLELWDIMKNTILQKKQIELDAMGSVEFHFENSTDYENLTFLKIEATLTEKLTGITQSANRYVDVKTQRYKIILPSEEIEFRNNKPHRLRVYVEHWSGGPVMDANTPVLMKHGEKHYQSHLTPFGGATFDFDHQSMANHVFEFKDSTMKFPNIFTHDNLMLNQTEYFCRLKLIGESLRLGSTVEIEVSSMQNIPYLVYTVIGHGSILRMELVKPAPNQKSFVICLTPSIEMIPTSFIYVHYVHNGILRYEELELKFPEEFENQVSLVAPKETEPGKEVTIEIRAEPNSYVSILAVDSSVSLLDMSYDLNKYDILNTLDSDRSYAPLTTMAHPGLLSGLITLTNAHYTAEYIIPFSGKRSQADIAPFFRSQFPETWIFKNLEINGTSAQMTLQIPDTITTWRITAFSNNDLKGFGVVNKPTEITTIKPFFITLNLPYSVKRGEIIAIPVVVFNYHSENLNSRIVMFNENREFHFTNSDLQETDEDTVNGTEQSINLNIPSDAGKTVSFYIVPLQLGEISLKISATSSVYSDAIQQKLKVEPEGIARRHNKATYITQVPSETFSSSFFLIFPDEIIPNSEYITLSVGGDYMVPALENLQDLVKLPYGCGEQNMIGFAANILLLQYLKINGKISKENKLVQKLRNYIEIGYQQQLSFRHKNGGYSVFGETSDTEPSVWLTAYVVRFLIKSVKYSPVEANIIANDLKYLARQQKLSGEFPVTGYLFSPTYQNEYGLTAFVLLAFLEDQKYSAKYQLTIVKGLHYLNSNLENIKDTYAIAIVAYALKLAKDTNANKLMEKLEQRSRTTANGLKWWSGNYKNTANDVEITSYSLMALLETSGDFTSILKWLIQERNARGGFKSTQDTVVGLQALLKFTEKHRSVNMTNLIVNYHAQDREGIDVHYDKFEIVADNMLVLQQHELPKTTRHIRFEVTGTGSSYIQLSYQYNIKEDQTFRHFLINPKVKVLNEIELDLNICFAYHAQGEKDNATTNMVIMEVNLPSGYRSDVANNFDIEDNELIQRIETKNSDSTIIFYFDSVLNNVENCVNFAADKISDVFKSKPAAIIVYDYYNLSRSNIDFYSI